MKTVVVFYSLEGSTALVAKKAAEKLGADLVELKPLKTFDKTGLAKYFLGGMRALFGAKPRLTVEKFALGPYDAVVLGTPVWAGRNAPPINTFLDRNNLQGKAVLLFATHRGGGAEKCFAGLEKRLAGSRVLGRADFIKPKDRESPALDAEIAEFCAPLPLK